MPEPTFISAQWLAPLVKKLLKTRAQLNKELAAIGDVFGDPYDLAKFYIEPKCQHHNPADYHEEEPVSIVQCPVFETVNAFLTKEFTTKGDGKNQMFILSDAGMGKTSLLMMLKLMHLTSFWPKSHDCVLLKLGTNTLDALKTLENKARTILLLDGLDEDPDAWGRLEQRVQELLRASSAFRRVIISCRTQFFPEGSSDPFHAPGRISIGPYFCPVIYLSLFSDEQVEDYLSRRFPNAWFRKLLKMPSSKSVGSRELVKKMESLRFRPMLLAHVEDILEAKTEVWNEYTIYQALLTAWLKREERKSNSRVTESQLLTACLVVAEQMQVVGERSLTSEAIESLVVTNPDLAQLSLIDVGGRSLLNRNHKGAFRFSHYTIQEFLIAMGIVDDRLNGPSSKLRLTLQIRIFTAYGLLTANTRGTLTPIKMLECLARVSYDARPSSILESASQEQLLEKLRSAKHSVRGIFFDQPRGQWHFLEVELRAAVLRGVGVEFLAMKGEEGGFVEIAMHKHERDSNKSVSLAQELANAAFRIRDSHIFGVLLIDQYLFRWDLFSARTLRKK